MNKEKYNVYLATTIVGENLYKKQKQHIQNLLKGKEIYKKQDKIKNLAHKYAKEDCEEKAKIPQIKAWCKEGVQRTFEIDQKEDRF